MNEELVAKKVEYWLTHIDAIINLWTSQEEFAAKIKKNFFFENRHLGSKDKKIVGGAFFFFIRSWNFSKNLSLPEFFLLAYNVLPIVKASINRLVSDEDFNLEIRKRITDDSFLSDFNELKSTSFFPEIYLRNLQMEASSLELLCEALNKEATTDIRIVSNRDLVEQELIENEIQFGSNFVRDCLKLQTNTDFHTYQGYKRAYFDIQDEGSQLVSIVLDPKPGENILDYCSGGGGKTVHIAALSNDLANITATDVSSSRLENTKRRVVRHKFTSVKIVSKDYINKETAQYDKILADVPCSGSGTVRRIPEIRYLMRSDKIDNYARVQLEIVQICWKKLKPGGELTYSTCSLFPKENERVIAKFLNFHKNAELVSISDRLESLDINTDKLHFGEYGVTLLPHRTNTDGFFISVLKKRV